MSYGPVRMDFTPLGQIGQSFINARDQAIDRQWKQMQMSAPGDTAAIIAQSMGQGGTQPPANIQPGQPGMTPLGSIGQYGSYNAQGRTPTFAGISGTPNTPELKPNDAARTAFNTLVSGGLTPGQAAGFLGNFAEESSFNPNAYNDKEGAIGFAQWRGPRADALKSFAAANGASPFDPAIQAKFALTEMSTDPQYRSAWQQLQVAKTPQEAAAAVIGWEKPGGWRPGDPTGVPSYNDRVGHAVRVAQTFGGQGGQGGPAVSMPAGTSDGPQDLPLSTGRDAQFVIPGSGQTVPAQGAPSQAAPYQVTAPQIPIPPYIQALAKSPNPFVRARATDMMVQYQQQQQQLAIEAWKLNQEHNYKQPFDQGNMEAAQAKAAAAQAQAETANRRLDYDMNGKPILRGPDQIMSKPDGTVIAGPQQYTDLVTPEERAAAHVDPAYQGPVQRKPNGELVYPGKPGTEISLSAEKAEEGAIGKAKGDLMAKAISAGPDAQAKLQTLAQLSDALNSAGGKVIYGPYAESILASRQAIGNLFGTTFEGVPANEAAKKLGYTLATQLTKDITNRPAQSEFLKALENVPGLSLSPEGNKALISLQMQDAQHKIELADLAAGAKNYQEYRGLEKQYYASHPLISPFTGKPFGKDDIALLTDAGKRAQGQATPDPNSGNPAPAPAPTKKLGEVPIPTQAVKDLQAMPDTPDNRKYFDDAFGVGAADRILGKKK